MVYIITIQLIYSVVYLGSYIEIVIEDMAVYM